MINKKIKCIFAIILCVVFAMVITIAIKNYISQDPQKNDEPDRTEDIPETVHIEEAYVNESEYNYPTIPAETLDDGVETEATDPKEEPTETTENINVKAETEEPKVDNPQVVAPNEGNANEGSAGVEEEG